MLASDYLLTSFNVTDAYRRPPVSQFHNCPHDRNNYFWLILVGVARVGACLVA